MRGALFAMLVGCGFQPAALTASGDDAGAVDAAIGDANDMFGTCAGPGAIRDNFDDPAIAAMWSVASANGTVVEQGSHLVVTPTGGGFAGYVSKHYIDLSGAAIEVEVPAMLDTATMASAELVAEFDIDHYVAIRQRNGMLIADVGNGATHTTKSVTYDAVQHRVWRISEAGGTVAFETSANGTTWTSLQTAPAPTFITALRIDLGAAATGGGLFGSVEFDNLDTQVPRATWCKADSLHDNFQRTTFGMPWQNRYATGGGCTPRVSTGAHTDQNGPPSTCYFGTSAAFDFTNSSVTVMITAITTYTTGWFTFLSIAGDGGGDVRLVFDNGQMCAVINGAATCRVYNQADSYWRIREAAGMVTLETSANMATWVPVATVADPFALDAVEVRFGTNSNVDLSGFPIGLDTSSYN